MTLHTSKPGLPSGQHTRHQTTPYTTLDLVLPATLWSASYAAHRADYTLRPRTTPPMELVGLPTSRRRRSSRDRDGPPSPSHWSIIGMQRRFIAHKYPHGVAYAPARAQPPAPVGPHDHNSPDHPRSEDDAEALRLHTSVPREGTLVCTRTSHTHGGTGDRRKRRRIALSEASAAVVENSWSRDPPWQDGPRSRSLPSPTGNQADRHAAALPTSTPGLSTSPACLPYEAVETSVEHCVPTSPALSTVSPPLPLHLPGRHSRSTDDEFTTLDTTAAAALDTVCPQVMEHAICAVEAVLLRVAAEHYEACPLCAPRTCPSWTSRSTWRRRPGSVRAFTHEDLCRRHGGLDPSLRLSPVLYHSAEDNNSTETPDTNRLLKLHYAVVRHVQALLAHQQHRVKALLASRPTMYEVSGEHPCIRSCRELGGIVLLEAILLGILN